MPVALKNRPCCPFQTQLRRNFLFFFAPTEQQKFFSFTSPMALPCMVFTIFHLCEEDVLFYCYSHDAWVRPGYLPL